MRILHLIHGLEIGGAERQLVTLVESMARAGVDQRVGLLQKRGVLASEIDQLGVPIVEFRLRHRTLFAGLNRLRSYLSSESIDVLHCHLHLPSIYGRLAAAVAGTPVRVWTEHSEVADRDVVSRAAERLLISLTTFKVTVSEEQARQTTALEGFPCDRVITLNNSVPVERFAPNQEVRRRLRDEHGLGPNDLVLATLSNLHARKRVDVVIRAVSALREAGVNVNLVVIGDGPDRPDLESLAGRLGLGEGVVFLGARNDVAAVLQMPDILVSASSWEGLPISMLEALASGLPIVATDVGGVPDLLKRSGGGLTVPACNPDSIVGPLLKLIERPSLRTDMGRCGREYVRLHHNSANNAEKLLDLYDSCLEGPVVLKG